MNRLRLFLENFFVYGLGGIISKAVPLIMIPIVTRIMPSSKYFGISDLANTLVSLASAFAILGMYDAMYRLFFEKEDIIYKKKNLFDYFGLYHSIISDYKLNNVRIA